MSNRTERLLEMLQILRERRSPVTAAALGERFAVSERTIYRDLETLTSLGAPVEGEAGVGFVLRPGFFLPPLALTQDEADAVLLGLRFVSRRGDPALAEAAGSVLSKIGAVLDAETERAMRSNGLAVGPCGSGAVEQLEKVRNALGAERKIRIDYRNAKGETGMRIVWPVAIGFFDSAEIVAGWCERRSAFRHFRLDRIASIELLPDRLPRPRCLLLGEYRRTERDADL